jgi:hypothetical protein
MGRRPNNSTSGRNKDGEGGGATMKLDKSFIVSAIQLK